MIDNIIQRTVQTHKTKCGGCAYELVANSLGACSCEQLAFFSETQCSGRQLEWLKN